MVKVFVKKENSNIKEILFKGHALYSDYGRDIVCASISSVINTTVNSIMNIDSTSIEYNDDGDKITIIKINSNDIVDKLLDTMINILKDLEKQYKKNIKVESEE